LIEHMQIFGKETQETIAAWALATFGDVKSTRSILTRANCEMAELVHAVECGSPHGVGALREKIASEIADVIIVLCRYPIDISEIGDNSCGLDPDDTACSLLTFADEQCSASRHAGYMLTAIADAIENLALYAQISDIDLPAAIDAKMAINRARKWESKGAGRGQHVAAPTVDCDAIMTALGVPVDPAFEGCQRTPAAALQAAKNCRALADNLANALNARGGARDRVAALETLLQERLFDTVDTIRLAAEYKAACAAIPNQVTAYHVDRNTGNFDVEAVAAYHVAITRAGNARRALLAYVAGDTPEVAS
jgi:NTP pyrophosphatase (non-canonical NTP hydrolase)